MFPGGGGVVTNGTTVTFFASATGTVLGSDVPQGTIGSLTQGRYQDHHRPINARGSTQK